MNIPPDFLGIGKTVEESLKVLKEPVQSLLGPAWSELAATWGDGVRHWRDMKRLERAISATKKIRAKGLTPRAVDPALLFPLLDAASLATDDDLKARWDTLLANAADPTGNLTILPAFTDILSQLTSMHARLLEILRQNQGETASHKLIDALATHGDYFELLASDLERLRVLEGRRQIEEDQRLTALDGLPYLFTAKSWAGVTRYHSVSLTPLGWAFMDACSPADEDQ